ncbi:MAG TPA: glucose-6-phosphate dehydrogenase assembly protein OpcA [Opitutaceae bacterium]|nr:glucose-6-phosphate dehydrogenase assembly protein OpcA [Opitutaceae bacterium]
MPSIFKALPGLEVPASAISKSMAQMWTQTASRGEPAPSAEDVKATQINLVLHFGFMTTADDAVAQFQTLVKFSERYPCRVVVLCPQEQDETSAPEILAKIYGECHLGKSKGDTRCCEYVILSYPMSARKYLEDQVSVCLSTDLPLYYWAHRFSSSARLSEYQYLLSRSKRVMFDSAIEPPDAFTFPWPKPESLRDLAHARLLGVRQSIGHFLSGYAPAVLAKDLRTVKVVAHPSVKAEGAVLLKWMQKRLANCGAGDEVRYEFVADAARGERSLQASFEYAGTNRFSCSADFTRNQADFEADFGQGKSRLRVAVNLLSPEAALGEAMFF